MSWEAEPPGQKKPATDPEAWAAAINLNNHSRTVGAPADELRAVLDCLFAAPRTDGDPARKSRQR